MANTQKTTAKWQQLIEGQKDSGLNIREYCQQHAISGSAFYAWRKKLKTSINETITDKPTANENTSDWLNLDLGQQTNKTHWNIELVLPNGVVLKMSQS